jgi:hypothetical protein
MTIRSVARWAFVNAAGRLPDYSLAFSKVAYWIRFSKWYMATGAKISKFDVIQTRINKRTYWLQKRLQIRPDEFWIALHLTEYTTQSAG